MILKKFAAIFSFTAFTFCNSGAQTVAQDWTLNDCDGNPVSLFSLLDNNEVVVMEFGMGCSSCYDAAAYLIDTLKVQYDITNPGKVKFFYMDYWVGNDCVNNVAPILALYNFDSGFEHCQAEKNYYISGSPMPGIVIASGPGHIIAYESNAFSNNDTTTIRTSIDNALMTMSLPVCECDLLSKLVISPNPTNGNITIQSSFEITSVAVFDITGKQIYSASPNTSKVNLDLTGITEKGIYFAEIIINGKTQTGKFVIE